MSEQQPKRFTLYKVAETIYSAIPATSNGLLPQHPTIAQGNAKDYLTQQVDLAMKTARREAGQEFWPKSEHPGRIPAGFTEEQVLGILDQLSEHIKKNNLHGYNLRRSGLTDKALIWTEEELFGFPHS